MAAEQIDDLFETDFSHFGNFKKIFATIFPGFNDNVVIIKHTGRNSMKYLSVECHNY